MDLLAKRYIELQVEQLHRKIWKQRERFFPNVDWSLTELFSPRSACETLGIQYEQFPFIDARFARAEEGNVIAGLIDRQSNRIVVCDTQSPQVMRFTGGHEIGHFCLHPDQVLHRDRPLSGSDVPFLKAFYVRGRSRLLLCVFPNARKGGSYGVSEAVQSENATAIR